MFYTKGLYCVKFVIDDIKRFTIQVNSCYLCQAISFSPSRKADLSVKSVNFTVGKSMFCLHVLDLPCTIAADIVQQEKKQLHVF